MKIQPTTPSAPLAPTASAPALSRSEKAEASLPSDTADVSARAVHKTTQTAPTSSGVLRDPQAAVAFCDRFNAGVGLSPSDLADKQALMVSGPLKLARCMPALMMSDLLGSYAQLGSLSDKPAPVVWIDGDAHLGNFGVVRGADGHAVWGLNDYDMTCQGSPAMDLDRLAFSLVSTMESQGMSAQQAAAVVDTLAHAYHSEIKSIAQGKEQGPAYLTQDQTSGAIKKLVEKADAVTHSDFIAKYAAKDAHGDWHFVYSDKVEPVDLATGNKIREALQTYDSQQGPTPRVARPLQVLGVAQKLQSGGSSHGQPRYYALVADSKADKPPLILEIKQELPPPLKGWTGSDPVQAAAASGSLWTGDIRKADAAQVVQGQAQMGGDCNPLTGCTHIDGISYLVREREACKATLSDKHLVSPDDFQSLAEQAGRVLAQAHGRSPQQALQILNWMGDRAGFSQKLQTFAQAYQDQAVADCQAYRAAHTKVGSANVPDTGD